MAQLRLFHNNKNLKTLKEFASFYNIKITDEFTIKDFFEYNRESIFNQLTINQIIDLRKELGKEKLTAEDLKVDMTLPCPCTLYVEQKYVTYNLHVKNNNLQYPTTDLIAFQDAEIQKIIQDPSLDLGEQYRKTIPGIRVMGWFKALHYYDKERGTSNGIDNIYNAITNFIDLSPYILSLNTTVNANGGSFSLTLPHIPLYITMLKGEHTPSILNSKGNVNADMGSQGLDLIINPSQGESFLSEDKSQIYVKSSLFQQDYFSWLLSTNDLLFISFNAMEGVVNDDLSNHVWDMIALIDSISISKDANGGVSVNVSGRDLMKLITDDSRIFFPNSVSNGTNCPFDNTEAVLSGGDINGILERNGTENRNENGELPLLDGTLPVFAMEPNDFTIDFVIKAVVSQLANMRIVPEFLFTSWGDKRTRFTDFTPIVKPTDENTKTTA